ncbi:Flp pilus-assembly TadG-like N-terminal domain-containing protein [Candidatus Liberibacter solanacearum]|uniref:CLIBASIA_04065 family virulence factor n=1 Tax=Candidatus Liberibacter solanacearum TaxID=556287 RepID=UPI003872337C
MFYYRNFLSFFSRLNHCTNGSFLIVSAVLLSSFVTIMDIMRDYTDMIRVRNMLQSSIDYALHNNPNELSVGTIKQRKMLIKKRIGYFLDSNYKGTLLTKEQINLIINQSAISITERSFPPQEYHIHIELHKTIQLKSLILHMAMNTKGDFDISQRKSSLYKKNVALMAIPFTWNGQWTPSSLFRKFMVLENLLPSDLKTEHVKLVNKRNQFLKMFLSKIKEDNLCIAPYHYNSIKFWSEGTFIHHLPFSTTIISTPRNSYRNKYSTLWDRKPFNYLSDLFDGAELHSKRLTSASPCFAPSVTQKKFMLIIAVGNQISDRKNSPEYLKMKYACDLMGKKPMEEMIVYSLGISPDLDTKRDLIQCARHPDRYYEIQSYKDIAPVIDSLDRNISSVWNDGFSIYDEQ